MAKTTVIYDFHLENRAMRLKGPLAEKEMMLLRAEVREGINQHTEIDIEFLSTSLDVKFDDIVGEVFTIEIDTEKKGVRYFAGHCVEAFFEGTFQGVGHYVASLRSWPWFLTQTADCRIFQDKSTIDIAKLIFGDKGFSNYEIKATGGTTKRPYCVQYRESSWNFLQRLFVEEGINWHMEYASSKDTLILNDDQSKYKDIDERSALEFYFKEDAMRRRDDHVFDWRDRETLRTAKVVLSDYDFMNSTAKLEEKKLLKKGFNSKHNEYEEYDFPGRFFETNRGAEFAKIRAEAYSAEYQRSRGISNVRTMAVGRRFDLSLHPRKQTNQKYLVIEAIHQIQVETDFDTGELAESVLGERVTLDPKKNPDPYRVTFRAQPAMADLRPPYDCPRPVIAGLQTAIVQGPKDKEIYTDKYGRIKVKFHWDRNPDAKSKPESLTCWIRTAVPWSGKNWGMVWVPRIGQEVVVLFKDGDPDYPVVVGMLYNDSTKHPYTLPDNMTQMGWTTRSTEKGKASTYHELLFEDKLEKEFIRFQSERDYEQIVKNNAKITVGLEHKDKGDYSLTIHNDMTELVKEGNHTFTVEKGQQDISVKKDQNTKVEGNQKNVVTKNQTVNIDGNKTDKIKGNHKETCSKKVTIKADSGITLQCGASKIVMTTNSIKISAVTTEVKGSGTLKLQGGMTDLIGSGIVKVQGPLVKIN